MGFYMQSKHIFLITALFSMTVGYTSESIDDLEQRGMNIFFDIAEREVLEQEDIYIEMAKTVKNEISNTTLQRSDKELVDILENLWNFNPDAFRNNSILHTEDTEIAYVLWSRYGKEYVVLYLKKHNEAIATAATLIEDSYEQGSFYYDFQYVSELLTPIVMAFRFHVSIILYRVIYEEIKERCATTQCEGLPLPDAFPHAFFKRHKSEFYRWM
jgi:hypothetical protein